MKSCFVPDCNHRTDNGSTCKFKPFPKTPSRRAKWMCSVARADRLPNKNSFVCSCHFPEGVRGMNARRTPAFFKRDNPNSALFSKSIRRARKKLLEFEVSLNNSLESNKSASFSSGILSSSVSEMNDSHADQLSLEELGVSQLDSCPVEDTPLDETLEDGHRGRTPLLSSTPHVSSSQPSSSSLEGFVTPLRRVSRKAVQKEQSPSSSHPSPWSVSGVDCIRVRLPRGRNTVSTQTEVSCSDAEVQVKMVEDHVCKECQGKIDSEKYVENSAQTSVVMFDGPESFAVYGDSMPVIKSLISEVVEWRQKLHLAEAEFRQEKADLSSRLLDFSERIAALQSELDKVEEDKENMENRHRATLAELDGKFGQASLAAREKAELLEIEKGRLLYQFISTVDARVNHFTGLPSAQIFNWLCNMFTMPLNYYYKSNVVSLSREDQLFLTLMKLKRNFDYFDLATWFNISHTTVANIFLTWLDALHRVIFLAALKTVPSREKNMKSLPSCFEGFEACRMIIDCTEVRAAVPSSMKLHNIMYSSYKKFVTLKGLLGIAPNGTVTYVSPLYPGSTSDKQIVEKCGVAKIFVPGDLVLADKGFTIRDLMPEGVDLNIPPFLTHGQFTTTQVHRTKKIARARIHVERAIQRIKEYKILDFIPACMYDMSSKVFQVCAALTNLKRPLISEVADKMDNCEKDWDDTDPDDRFDAVWWQ